MHPTELWQQAEAGFDEVSGFRYEELAGVSRQQGSLSADARYFILSECFAASGGFWGSGDSGGVTTRFAVDLAAIWDRHLRHILEAVDVETGVVLAEALQHDLRALGSNDPLKY